MADIEKIKVGETVCNIRDAQAYVKPAGGVPKSDLASGVQSSLGAADTAYQKPAGGVPKTDLESAVQNSLGAADTAYQKPVSGIPASDLASGVQTSLEKAEAAAPQSALNAVIAKIPEQASSENQLADKAFVNSTAATATATHRGTYNLVTDLSLTTSATQQQIATAIASKLATLSIVADNNDYVFVQIPTADATPTEIARVDRYKYNGTEWGFEYSLNNSGFTAAQWAAINSGVTSALVSAFSAKYDKPSGGIPASDMASAVQTSLGKADTAYQKPGSGIPSTDLASGVVPTISTDIATDKASDVKTASPKAVYDAIHPATQNSQPAGGMRPNILYTLGTLTGSVTFALDTTNVDAGSNHYYWTFDTSSTPPADPWPSGLSWIDGAAPTLAANKHYEVSVMNNIAIAVEV